MDWKDLKSYFQNKYDFIERIRVSNSNRPSSRSLIDEPLHPLLKYSGGLTLDSIQNHKQLAVAFPDKTSSAFWVSLVSALDNIKSEASQENFQKNLQFEKGEHLLVNGCVVRFEEEYYSEKWRRWEMKVSCGRNGDDKYIVPLNLKLNFQKTTRKRLSALNKISAICQNEQIAIDNLLKTRTLGNLSLIQNDVILVAKTPDFRKFNNAMKINKTEPANLFLWGRLNEEGSIRQIDCNAEMSNHPSCLLARNFYGIPEYLDANPGHTKAILIDGTSVPENMPGLFDQLLYDFKIPIVVISNEIERENLNDLIQKDFLLWNWDRKNIQQSHAIKKSETVYFPFYRLNKTISNYCKQDIQKTICSDSVMDELLKNVFSLNRAIDQTDSSALQDLSQRLWQHINKLAHLVYIPDVAWLEQFEENLNHLYQSFANDFVYIEEKMKAQVEEIYILALEELENIRNSFKNSKIEAIKKLLEDTEQTFYIVVSYRDKQEINLAKTYWDNQPEYRDKLEIVSYQQLIKEKEKFDDKSILVAGWFGGRKIAKLLHSYITPDIRILLYPLENKWWQSAQRRWNKEKPHGMTVEQFSDLTGIDQDMITFIDEHVVKDEEEIEPEHFSSDILELETSLDLNRKQRYITRSSSASEEPIKVKLVIFSEGSYSFMTETRKYPVIELDNKDQISVENVALKAVQDISVGDSVVFSNTNRDLIRQVADDLIAREYKWGLRDLGSLWQKALKETYQTLDKNFDYLVETLKSYGCNKNTLTIRNWLFNEDMLGPRSEKDLEIIKEATGHEEFRLKFKKVISAISELQGYHLKAGYKLKTHLVELLQNKNSQDFVFDGESYTFTTNTFGEITVVEAVEIQDWQEISLQPSRINNLLSEEE